MRITSCTLLTIATYMIFTVDFGYVVLNNDIQSMQIVFFGWYSEI